VAWLLCLWGLSVVSLNAWELGRAARVLATEQVRASAAAEAERTANRPESPTPSAFGSLVATQDQSREEGESEP
jgi:hypothetical protein